MEIDTTNRFAVGIMNHEVVVFGEFRKTMSATDAMNLAAYLVVMAEAVQDENCPDFKEVLKAITTV